MSKKSVRTKLRHAQFFDPPLFAKLHNQLQSGSVTARALNFSIVIGYKTMRASSKARSLLKSKLPRGTAVEAAPTPAAPTDIYADLKTTAAPVARSKRILIVAELSIPQCRKYRVDHKVSMLESAGYDVDVVAWHDAVAVRGAIQLAAMVIFYRTPAFESVRRHIGEAKRLGIPTIFEIDDLVFDLDEYSKNSNIADLAPDERQTLMEGAQLYQDCLSLCDHAIASTSVIADHMRKFNRGSIHIIENAVDPEVELVAAKPKRPAFGADEVVIGYGSGTRTHDADLALVADALDQILTKYPNVRLALHGPLALPKALQGYGSRIARFSSMPADAYYRSFGAVDIAIAPLEHTLFSDAKSNIKYLEASTLGLPSVCSPTRTFREVIEHGRNGYVAGTTDEWVQALSELVESPAKRASVAKAASATAARDYSLSSIADRQLAPVLSHLPKPDKTGLQVMTANVLYSPHSFGGATLIAEQLGEGLLERGFAASAFTTALRVDAGPYELVRYSHNGVDVCGVNMIPTTDPRADYLNDNVTAKFASALETMRPDVVHMHAVQQLGMGLAAECQRLQIPYVITVHDAWWLCQRQFMVTGKGRYCFQKRIDSGVCASCVDDSGHMYARRNELLDVLHGAALVLAPSEFQRDLYLANGVDPRKIVVNKNGVVPPARFKKKPSDGRVRLAFLGGRAEHKGYFWLRDIMRRVNADNYVLKVVDIQRKIGHHVVTPDEWSGLKGELRIVGPYEHPDIDAFFEDIDVLLFPSRCKESFGLTTREAMLRDCWVIATNSGGTVEDIAPSIDGDVVEMDDAEGFKQAIERVLADPSKVLDYSAPNKDKIRTLDQQVDELAELLRGVAQPRASAEGSTRGATRNGARRSSASNLSR